VTALQSLAILGAAFIAAMLYGFTRDGFWTWACAWLWRPLGRFCRHMVSTPRRGPGPAHPSRRARRIRLTDEQVRSRLQAIAEAEQQRNGGQR
jgi:hypothetical protein